MSTADETTGAAHPVVKLRAYPFHVFASCLRLLHGHHPTDPFIASEWSEILPYRQSFGIKS